MIKVEVFASMPPCSGGRLLLKLIESVKDKYAGRVEFIVFQGENEKTEEYGIKVTPAIVVDKDIRIIGVCPSRETLENALFEAGV
ncbi:MAG TPA: thioredoxin family protein [Candidatus Methanofastidiosa archaeon]|nr:thioredoxin family protein [Candidatus Methanofastidiosa archaeon]